MEGAMGMRLFATLLGPITLLALVGVWFWRWRRIHHERRLFKMAIDQHWTLFWAGLIGGVLASLVISLGLWLLHVHLPIPVLGWFTVLDGAAFLLAGLGFGPWLLAFAGIAAWAAARWLPWSWLAIPAFGQWAAGSLALVALVFAAEALLLWLMAPAIDVPKIKDGRRGARIASYTRRQFYWLPLLVTLPTGHFVFLPLLSGAALTTRKQLPTQALRFWTKAYAIGGAVVAGLAGWAYAQPALSLWPLGIAAAVGLIVALACRWADQRGISYISQTTDGVRLVAILPDTPASKMGLQAGDIVLKANNIPVASSDALYEALQAHPTYCRLRVQRLDGAVRLTETAIFTGAPHELGMITFAEDN